MQKLYSIVSLSLMWLVLTNYSGGLFSSSKIIDATINTAEQRSDEAYASWMSLACQDTINVTLDAQCQFSLTLDNVAAGNLPDCLTTNDFQLLVDDTDPTNQSMVDDCGVWRYYLGLNDNAPDCSDFEPCWGYIRAEDKSPPMITPPPAVSLKLSCRYLDSIVNNPESMAFLDTARVQDNCDPTSRPLLAFSDVLVNSDNCADLLIRRTFTATDDKGNRASATQDIRLERPELADTYLSAPVYELDVDCNAQSALKRNENGYLHPDSSGYPVFQNAFGEEVPLGKDFCGIAATYIDQPFEICGALEKIERTWIVSDWCTGMNQEIKQLILVGDLTPPEIEFPSQIDTFTTTAFHCRGNVELIRPMIDDKCSLTSTQVELHAITTNFRQEKDTSFFSAQPLRMTATTYFENVPIGSYLMIYQVEDACKNRVRDTILVQVEDRIKPVAKCIDDLHVTLDNYGFGRVSALDIDEGSTDNCQLDSLQVRRLLAVDEDCIALEEPYYTDWEDQVYFNCCDREKRIPVELRAKDQSGNESICWTEVLLEDKVNPECIAPPSVVIDCDSLPRGFDYSDPAQLSIYFGTATGVKACIASSVIELTPKVELGQCGYGTVTRSFEIEDVEGRLSTNECEQIIEVNPVHNYEIKFPEDYSTVCAEPDPDSLEVNVLGCDLIAVSINDNKHTAAADECFKIFRKYRVINWCEYDGVSDPVIVPRNADCDSIPGDEDVYVLVRDTIVYLDSNNIEFDSIPLRDSIEYDCFGQMGNPWGHWTNSDSFPDLTSRGFWEYTQVIKVTDTIAPTIFVEDSIYVCITEENCFAEATVSFAILDECVDGDVIIKTYVEDLKNEYREYEEDPWALVGRYPKYLMSGIVPEGSYRVEIEANDQCGNVSQVAYHLEVVDCRAPSIICRDGIVVELMPQVPGTDVDNDGDFDPAANIIHVESLIASPSKDDCAAPVSYSINRAGVLPDQEQKTLTLTCEDGDFLPIEVYAWDSANNPLAIQPNGLPGGPNYDHCKTFVRIQDNQNACNPADGAIDIAGVITSPTGEVLSNVEVVLSGADSKIAYSNLEGTFYIPGLREGHDYTIAPRKRDELLKGVSTLDIIYMSKHILGIQPLSMDLQLLAADINRSGSVSTLDIILLRKAILTVDRSAMDRVGWQFINAKTEFDNQGNPWSKPIYNSISLNNIEFPRGDLDFIGIKMGDVSGLRGLRSAADASPILLRNHSVRVGESVRLPLYLPEGQDWEGLQLSLGLNKAFAKNLRLRSDFLQEGHYSLSENKDKVTVSWDRFSSTTVPDGQPLFYLEWEAIRKSTLDQQLQIAARSRESEGYTPRSVVPLYLQWEETIEMEARVYPNPFTQTIHLRWNADDLSHQQNRDMVIRLMDLQGRVIKQYPLTADQQTGNLRLEMPIELPNGMYVLQLIRGDYQKQFRVVKNRN